MPKNNRALRLTLTSGRKPSLRLTLPSAAVERLADSGIRCTPDITLEHQKTAGRHVLRGREQGGAVKEIGRYVSYCAEDGRRLAWFIRPDLLTKNSDHAIVIAPALVSVEMFRFEHTYELLIMGHTIPQIENGARPTMHSQVIFRGRNGQLPLDLLDRDKSLAGSIAPEFFDRSGEPLPLPPIFTEAIQKITAAVNCLHCSHCHLLIAKSAAEQDEKSIVSPTAPQTPAQTGQVA
jgi:hypothetical protein